MNRNTDGLKSYQRAKSNEKFDAVKKAVSDLKILNQEINFVSVATKSGFPANISIQSLTSVSLSVQKSRH